MLEKYYDRDSHQGSGGAATIGDWFCIGTRPPGGPTSSNDSTKCNRGADKFVTVPSGSGTSPAGSIPDPDGQDGPDSTRGRSGTGISTSPRAGSPARRRYERSRAPVTTPAGRVTIAGWDCTTLNPGSLGEGAMFRCTQGAKAFRWSVGD